MTPIGVTTTMKIVIITMNFVSINSISVGSEVLKMYYRITCTNGYYGYDEDFYIEAENDSDAWNEADEILENDYSFIEPDERFIDMNDEEELEAYAGEVQAFVEEITEEEYLEAKEWGY